MTLTADYQAELRGVVLGPSSDYPHAAAPQGFGTPSYRTGDQPRPLDHGEFAGLDLMNGRTVVFDVWVVGDDDTEAAANLNALKAAFAPSSATLELSVRLAGTDYALLGRPRGVVANIEYVRDGVARARCEFKALDPRLYSLEVTDSPGRRARVPAHVPDDVRWCRHGRCRDRRERRHVHGAMGGGHQRPRR